jgi:hypothetical protein
MSALSLPPIGAALISTFAKNVGREGGWIAIRKAYRHEDEKQHQGAPDRRPVTVDTDTQRIELPEALRPFGKKAKWIRIDGTEVQAVLVPNGASRTSAIQIEANGKPLVVRMPPKLGARCSDALW